METKVITITDVYLKVVISTDTNYIIQSLSSYISVKFSTSDPTGPGITLLKNNMLTALMHGVGDIWVAASEGETARVAITK